MLAFQNLIATLQFVFSLDLIFIILIDFFSLNSFIELKFVFNFIIL
jgi:hypothetical protein